jgi:non-ribosomal peptide synthetase component F
MYATTGLLADCFNVLCILLIDSANADTSNNGDCGAGLFVELVNVDIAEPFNLKPYDINREEVAKFDLTFAFSEANQQLELYLNYNVNVFNDNHIQVIEDTIKTVFNAWVFQPSLTLSKLSPVSDIQIKKLIEFGKNDVAIPKSSSNNVVEQMDNLLSEQFCLTALKDASGSWTFGKLNRMSSLIAYYLIEKNKIQKGEIVLVALSKSNQAIAAILGVLKSGAAYLPIDENLPEERLTFIKADSEARYIIDEEFMDHLFKLKMETPDNYVFPTLTGDDLAYCIYTSGSTGKPKGTLVSHESLFTQTQARLNFYAPSSNALFIPPLYFDASVAVIFPALLSSSVIHILDENDLSSFHSISKYINEHSIDYLLASPGFYRVFFHSRECFSSVKTIIIGGESTSNEFKKSISNFFPKATIFIE